MALLLHRTPVRVRVEKAVDGLKPGREAGVRLLEGWAGPSTPPHHPLTAWDPAAG